MKLTRSIVRPLGACLLAAAFFFLVFVHKLDDVGVWDPVELDHAEAARTAEVKPTGWLAQHSIALGFRLLGTNAFAGRLPLVVWGLVGVFALFALVASFRPKRVAVWAAAALSTMPLYFVQSRTMLGDIVTTASGSVALAGLAIATFAAASPRVRLGSLGLGLLGVVCGVLTRGALIGAAVPSLAVGIVWALTHDVHRGRLSRIAGSLSFALGVCAVLTFVVARHSGQHTLLIGFQAAPGDRPTFDTTIANVVHSTFPWSALLPFAFAKVFARTALPVGGDEKKGRDALGPLFCLVAFIAYGAHAIAGAPSIAFCAPYALAGIITLSLSDLGRHPHSWAPLAAFTTCFAFLIARDYIKLSEKVFSPYALANVALPESFRTTSDRTVWLAAGALIAGVVVTALAAQLPLAHSSVRRHGATIVLSCAVISGLVFRLRYYPQLGTHLSPKGAFDSYNKLRKKGEPLGLLSVDPRGGRYMHAGDTIQMPGAAEAFTWLTNAKDRHWLLLRGGDLPTLNALQREKEGRNLTILDARSSEMLLATNQLAEREHNDNPLDQIVLAQAPPLPHRLDAKFGESLEPLGWLTLDGRGQSVEGVSAGRTYRLRIFYRVTDKLPGAYCTFIHIEHTPTRFSAEHKEAEWARYPMRFWRKGDVIADEFAVSLPASFRAGKYPLYIGLDQLPCVGDHRVPVTRGAHVDQRLEAGLLEVLP